MDQKTCVKPPSAPQALAWPAGKVLEHFRAARGSFWTSPGRSWLARGAPRSALGRHLGAQKPSQAHPDASLQRPWAPKSVQDRFFIDLGPFGVDFRRFSPELCATKTQKQNLKKESCDPQRTSWLLRCALVSYCSHVVRIDFRTLHVQPFFVAYPQAHLV